MKIPSINTKEFIGIIQDILSTAEYGDRKFCFILGAGASRNSNIPTGIELAARWFQEIEQRMSFLNFELWVKDAQIDKTNLGSKYPEIYLKRFEMDKQSAFDFLYEAMRDANPSIGYAILAQVLANTKNNVVITTNFDSLVEQSLYYYTSKKPLVCGHESLSNYARPYADRPLIIKIHRDLFYNPFSEPHQVNTLADSWKNPLRKVFDQYIPIVIGYAGNDGSLMDYLTQVDLPDKFFWCYRKSNPPDKRIEELLSKKTDPYLVEIAGFDEIMYELLQIFKLDLLDGIIKKRFEIDINKLTVQYSEISHRLGHEKSVEGTTDMVNYLMQNNSDPVGLYLYIDVFVSDKVDKLFLINKTLERFPNAPLLLSLKAKISSEKSDYDEAETCYNLAIKYGENYPIVLNHYAKYLEQHKHNIELADKYYSKSVVQMPTEASFLLDYANFLRRNKRDYDLSEVLLKSAIKYSPDSYEPYFFYGLFLLQVRKEKETSFNYLSKALEYENLQADHALIICTVFVYFEKNIEVALEAYKALTMDMKIENEAAEQDEGVFLIMRDYGTIEKILLKKIDKEPSNPNHLIRIAWFYLTIQKNEEKARRFYNLVPETIDNKIIKEVIDKKAMLLCELYQNYEEAARILKPKEPNAENDYITLGLIYKNFLGDFEQANYFYNEYLNKQSEKEPFFSEFLIFANLADLHFYFDKVNEASAFLNKAFGLTTYLDSILCLWFYRFMYEPNWRAEALSKIYELLECGVRNPSWEFRYNIIKLEERNHPDISLIKRLSKRITEYADTPTWYKIEENN